MKIPKRKTLACLVLFSLFTKAQQNLVPNGGFEGIGQCPVNCLGATTLTLAVGWQNPNIGTSDLFNSCDTQICGGWNAPCHGMPSNCWGWQNAQTGSSYAGIVAWAKPSSLQNNIREYAQIQLSDSLKTGQPYCVSFYVSLADSLADYATSRLGAFLSQNSVNNTSQFLIPATPQILNPFGNFMIDKVSWTEIKGIYSSMGGEKYVTIGNFYDDTNTDTLFISQRFSDRSYYFLEDVSVVEYSAAFSGADTFICSGNKVDHDIISTFGAQYNWSVLNGDVNSLDSTDVASPSFSPSVTTTYVLEKRQCGILSYDTLLIRVPLSYPAIVPNDTVICIGDTMSLTAINNCNWCNHIWSTGLQTMQIIISPTVMVTYLFFQTDSCFTTVDEVKVEVEYCNSPVIVAPNIFTPNGDEINDIWLPQIKNELSVANYDLSIYDRWGILVFETEEYNAGWDGRTTSGLECLEGTYYYTLSYADAKTREIRGLKGFLQLSK